MTASTTTIAARGHKVTVTRHATARVSLKCSCGATGAGGNYAETITSAEAHIMAARPRGIAALRARLAAAIA